MHYQGIKVPLSEKNSRFQSAGIETRRSWGKGSSSQVEARKGKEKKKFSLRMFIPDPKPQRKPVGVNYSFYRPGVTPPSEGWRENEKDEKIWEDLQSVKSSASKEERGGTASSASKSLKNWAGGSLAVALILTGWWAKQKGVEILQNSPQLKLSRIVVEGEHYLTPDQVLSAANLTLGTNLFKLNLENVDQNLKKLSWVSQVFVERDLPSSLIISIRERKPVALLDNGDLYGVDENGRIMSPSETLLDQDLPLISGLSFGPDAVGTTLEAQMLKPALDFFIFLGKKDSVLAHDVSEVNLSEPDALQVTFINGMEATFNPKVTTTDLKRMALVLGDLNDKGKRAETMDFRYANMVFVRAQ